MKHLKDKEVKTNVDSALLEQIKQAAERLDISYSQLVRQAIRKYLKELGATL